MAKKFVRGITDVKTITNQDFDTNNVNDLLSDGQYNYIHRKKGKNEEYHNLTDNIKTISSDNTDLLTVTNNNKTTNTATLHPKHDAQKEQVLESTRNTVTINHGKNGTAEKTTVDTNPKKVLEHENLLTDYGINKTTAGNTTKLDLEYIKVPDGFDLNTLTSGNIRGSNLTNAPSNNASYFIQTFGHAKGDKIMQTAFERVNSHSESTNIFRRYKINNSWGDWREQVGDKSVINGLLAQKEQVLESKLNELDNKIPTSVGTVNLFKGSRDFSGTSWVGETGEYAESYQGVKIFKKQSPWLGISQYFEVKAGEEYVFSAYVKSSAKTDRVSFFLQHASKEPQAAGVLSFGSTITPDNLGFDITDKYQRIAIKIKITQDGWIVPRIERANTNAYLFYGGYKLERYNVPTDYSPNPEDVNTLLAQKQNKLTAGDGISITGDSIYLTSLNDYSKDLNNLTYTCTAKPIDNTPNLPTGVGGNGVLSVIRVGNVVSQTYHALDNNVYYRITNNSSTTFVWTPWVKVNTTALS